MLQRSNLNKIVHSYKLVDVLITYQEALINCSQSPEKQDDSTLFCVCSCLDMVLLGSHHPSQSHQPSAQPILNRVYVYSKGLELMSDLQSGAVLVFWLVNIFTRRCLEFLWRCCWICVSTGRSEGWAVSDGAAQLVPAPAWGF